MSTAVFNFEIGEIAADLAATTGHLLADVLELLAEPAPDTIGDGDPDDGRNVLDWLDDLVLAAGNVDVGLAAVRFLLKDHLLSQPIKD